MPFEVPAIEVPGLPCQNVAGRLAIGLPVVAAPVAHAFEVPALPISVKPEREGQHLAGDGEGRASGSCLSRFPACPCCKFAIIPPSIPLSKRCNHDNHRRQLLA